MSTRTASPSAIDRDIASRVREAVAAAEGRQALDLKVLALGEVSDFTDYFVLMSGANGRQVRALADAVDERLRQASTRPLHVEGYQPGSWVLLDYGDFVVHIFEDEVRRFYGLEGLWSDAPEVTATFRS